MIILLFSMHSIFIYVSEQFFKFCYSRTDGQENLNSEFYRDYTLDDWLYEIGMECNKVYGVSYYREKNDPANIYARVSLSEPGTAL